MNDDPVRELNLSGSRMSGLMQAVLEKNACFRFMAGGYSMTPFIRDKDIITVFPATGSRIGPGDIAACANFLTDSVIVHRIIGKKDGEFIFKGDNCLNPDGRFAPDRIVGVVGLVERGGRQAWFGGGPEKRLIAFISRTGILNRLVLPVLRMIKRRKIRFFP